MRGSPSRRRSTRISTTTYCGAQRIVRGKRAKDPLITVSGLEHGIEADFQRGFSHQYVSKIADKVAREGLIEADRTQIEDRMNFTRENCRMMRDRMLKTIYWQPGDSAKPPANKDVIEAAKNVVKMDLALLSAEIARHVQEASRGARQGNPLRAAAAGGAHHRHRSVDARGPLPSATVSAMVPTAEPGATECRTN